MLTASNGRYVEAESVRQQHGRTPGNASRESPSLLMYTLERARFAPAAEADGNSAWKHMADMTPDLQLLDRVLPELSGIELLRRMRQDDRLSEGR